MIQTLALSFLVGVAILHYSPQLPPSWLLLAGPLALVSALSIKSINIRSQFIRIILVCVIGFTWAQFQASSLLKHRLPDSYIGKDITVTGYIASLPDIDERKIRFEFDIDEVLDPDLDIVPTRIRLSWYQRQEDRVSKLIRAGDKWQFTVRLKPPRNFANPGAFNYSGWLLQKKILSIGYIRNKSDNKLLETKFSSYPVQRFRQSLRNQLLASNIDAHFQPFLLALVIGDRGDMSAGDWAVLKNTGTVHLMAISGLHIGLIAGLVFFLGRTAWSTIPYLTLRFAAPRAAAILSWLSALSYAALAGFSLPTLRALIMLSFVLMALVLKKPIRPAIVLSLALLTVLVWDSFAVLSVSFWLSFSAIAVIYYFLTIRASGQTKLKQWFVLQIIISLGLLPLTIQFFQQAPIISPVTNLIAVPVVGFVIVPLAILGTATLLIHHGLGTAILSFTAYAFNAIWDILEWFSLLPVSTVTFATPTLLTLLLACAGFLLLTFPSALKVRILAVVLLVPLVFPYHQAPDKGEASLTVLDVGQGLSAVIQTRHHAMVFDTGPRFSRHFDTGRAVVLPYLNEKGIDRLDSLMISHGDNDHIGGAESLLTAIGAGTILTSVPDKLPWQVSRRCERGQHWFWDEVKFEILHPDASDYSTGLSENNLSCVLQVTTMNHIFLLTGDIEKEAEVILLDRYQNKLVADTLLAPHHGSKTSSSREFITTVSPKIIIIPAGWRNRYHFPHPSVLQTYAQEKSVALVTSQQGAITVSSDTDEISSFREQAANYWDSP